MSAHLVYRDNGIVVGLTVEGSETLRKLSLNSPARVDFRRRWIENWLRASKQGEEELVLGWPRDLPDLTQSRPQTNRHNTDRCYFQLRSACALPAIFIDAIQR